VFARLLGGKTSLGLSTRVDLQNLRHCERSEAIQGSFKPLCIASLRSQ
jgi:hypothetical protein